MEKEVGRNGLCSCGSGKKFKKCCGMQSTPIKKHSFSKINHSSKGLSLRHITGVVSRTIRKIGVKETKDSEES